MRAASRAPVEPTLSRRPQIARLTCGRNHINETSTLGAAAEPDTAGPDRTDCNAMHLTCVLDNTTLYTGRSIAGTCYIALYTCELGTQDSHVVDTDGIST